MWFPVGGGLQQRSWVKAVDGVTFGIGRGQTLGLVGESGCGKSTLGRAILQLYAPSSGKVIYDGRDLTELIGDQMTKMRRHVQMIFQDPYASLNPRMTVGKIISEPLDIHFGSTRKKKLERVGELLTLVGLNPSYAERYASDLSGGQRQRVGIARTLAVEPKLIVCDEPVSALDVSIQAQIINLLEELQKKLGLTYLFIAHDLSVVRHISDRIAVMYLGKIVEIADCDDFYERPLHPYSKALLSAVPVPDPTIERQRERIILRGEIPSPVNPPQGCSFHTRCPFAEELCRNEIPTLDEADIGHQVACHFWPRLEQVASPSGLSLGGLND